MVDEMTTGPIGEPDPLKKAAVTPPVPTAQNEPEPVILEERIITPAAKAAPAPQMPKPAPQKPAPDTHVEPVSAVARVVSDTPAPQKEAAPLSEPHPISGILIPPAPSTMRDNISRILGSIKLPERREFKAAADIPKPATGSLETAPAVAPTGKTAMEVPDALQSLDAPAPAVEHGASSVVPLRTLKDDLQTIVREQKISLVRAVSLEEEKRSGQERIAPEQREIRSHRSRRTFGILFSTAVLVLLGAGALFGVFFVEQERTASPATIPDSSILFSEQTASLPIDNLSPQDLKAQLAQVRLKSLGALGSITRIVPTVTATGTSGTATTRLATIQEFLSALGANPPDELLRAIGPDFFFGFHVVDKNAPLFVIPVTSYDHAFAGMLTWESTMNADLSPVFTSVPSTIIGSGGLPTTRTFQDAVLRNYDIRELNDDSGTTELYYSFPTPNILVIAESPYSFSEILSRLQAQREL
jgi:hypothetical protein